VRQFIKTRRASFAALRDGKVCYVIVCCAWLVGYCLLQVLQLSGIAALHFCFFLYHLDVENILQDSVFFERVPASITGFGNNKES